MTWVGPQVVTLFEAKALGLDTNSNDYLVVDTTYSHTELTFKITDGGTPIEKP